MNQTELPRQGRLAGVDFGEARIGLAVSDATQLISSPHETYHRQTRAADTAHIRQFAQREEIVGFVVGLPIHPSGDESEKSQQARHFANWLAEISGLPVVMHDERYSTAFANQQLVQGGLSKKKRKQRRDMVAAQIILASFLESRSAESESLD